jgi:hypothetical protein
MSGSLTYQVSQDLSDQAGMHPASSLPNRAMSNIEIGKIQAHVPGSKRRFCNNGTACMDFHPWAPTCRIFTTFAFRLCTTLHNHTARVLLLRGRVEHLALGAQPLALGDQIVDLLSSFQNLAGVSSRLASSQKPTYTLDSLM